MYLGYQIHRIQIQITLYRVTFDSFKCIQPRPGGGVWGVGAWVWFLPRLIVIFQHGVLFFRQVFPSQRLGRIGPAIG